MATTLDLALLYLLAAVVGVVVCRSLKLPPMLGYLAVGVVIGPNALALAKDTASIRYLAEFGVVFLMFVIGLEFSLPRLRAMRREVFGLGLSQVMLTMLAVFVGNAGLSLALGWLGYRWGIGWASALALGAALAMSSTAIVVKLMAERLELESEHGRRVMGVLLFQDLAVVPLLVIIPALGGIADGEPLGGWLRTLGLATLKGAVLLAIVISIGPRIMRSWLTLVARRKSEELFMLNLLLITLGLAWLTEHAGLSLALGAFVAGMLVAETEYQHQVEADIRPFQDVLLGLFFITIGMKLDWRIVLESWPQVLLLTTLPVLFKAVTITGLARLFGAPLGTAMRTGLYLAQAGEFGFVLLRLAHDNGLMTEQLRSPVLASMILSMLATPLIIQWSERIVLKLAANDWLLQSVAMTTIARRAINTSGHVIICGYGRSGQNVAHVLQAEKVQHIALDLDPDRVRQAAAAGHAVVFGDAARLQSLMAAGLGRASAVVVSYHNIHSALKILQLVRQHAPKVPVIVRAIDDANLERLRAAGAAEVVPEAVEGSLMLASQALALTGVPIRRIMRRVRAHREARYRLLRGYFHGATDESLDDAQQERLHTVILTRDAAVLGQRIDELPLADLAVTPVSLRLAAGQVVPPSADRVLAADDALVLSGSPDDLLRAETRLLRG
ncbi:MAG: cation:proton antiporter [Pseudomonadota bacterium]